MINVQDFSLRIGARELVRDASFRVDKGMRIGLVGRNGAGKTTTMRLLAGEADRGGAAEHTGTISTTGTIGYLAQDTHVGDQTVLARDRIVSVRGIDQIIARIRRAEQEMSTTEGARQQRAMERYVRLDQEFTNQGGWAANAEAAQIAHSLGLPDRVLGQSLDTLSGGQRRRVELARVLFSGADVLLLDEPTNHLDHDSVLWLRDWIKTFPGGVMVISHDAALLGETVNQVFYLDANRARIDIYRLGWRAYLEQRKEDERRRRKEREGALRKAEQLRAQGEKMRAKATKAVAAQQMLRRADELVAPLARQRRGHAVVARHLAEGPLAPDHARRHGHLELRAVRPLRCLRHLSLAFRAGTRPCPLSGDSDCLANCVQESPATSVRRASPGHLTPYRLAQRFVIKERAGRLGFYSPPSSAFRIVSPVLYGLGKRQGFGIQLFEGIPVF
ncbi:ATP-binding cassette domain-containing protein [uncultured Fretibacterium sp.]|uniref:ATP-binding cassette domain-containing protein n=1 Tax=uncultured Fretibacterium sp. TaxID=1678694 RepID=UPI00262EEC83|nr:ATP-binding cassette domain-containing protein [uncultured Fretibacterium sp.]